MSKKRAAHSISQIYVYIGRTVAIYRVNFSYRSLVSETFENDVAIKVYELPVRLVKINFLCEIYIYTSEPGGL